MDLLSTLVLAASLTSPAVQEASGATYSVAYNPNGAVLTHQKDRIYLGVDCDAISGADERGFWAWANGGFVIEFPKRSLGFARQDIEIFNEKCRM